MSSQIAKLRRELAKAEKASAKLCEQRAALPPGTSRAKVTTLNAKWARAAEYRDLLQGQLARLEKP